MTNNAKVGPMLRLVLAAGAVLQPLARPLLTQRLKRGKEDPVRWGEKLGKTDAIRPDGPLVWMHGVGVGEVMALRGLIADMSAKRADLQFLVTSSARASGNVFAKNLPPRTRHQYLPLDLPGPVAAFYDHWRPDLAVWSDQEVWPRLAVEATRRDIPQAYVAARITDASAKAKTRFGKAYGDLYRLLDVRHAQDAGTAAHLAALMEDDTPVHVSGSLKAAAAPLVDDALGRQQVVAGSGRPIWVAASAHPVDIEVAIDVQHFCATEQNQHRLLIIAPRDLSDATQAIEHCDALGLEWRQRSTGALPASATDVYIADTFGELGLWYRSAFAALIGGTFDATQGHNPWEAVALNCPVLHGPCTSNFLNDYKLLKADQATYPIGLRDSVATLPQMSDILAALDDPDLAQRAQRAAQLRSGAMAGMHHITDDLLRLLAR